MNKYEKYEAERYENYRKQGFKVIHTKHPVVLGDGRTVYIDKTIIRNPKAKK